MPRLVSRCRRALAALAVGILLVALNRSPVRGEPAPTAEDALPRMPPVEPADAPATFGCVGGFQMQLLAAEPLVTDPVAMEYDENGLAYVAEMLDYPYTDKSTDQPFVERTADRPIGRVRILEDTDGDGRFDKSTVFADELSWPTGLALWRGGVYVAATPDVWYLKDTDGDRRADVRRKVFTGFRKFNVQAVMNNLKWGLDHRIYGAGSSNGGDIRRADHPAEGPVVLGRNDFSFDPRDEVLELESGGARFGNAFDDWGRRFVCNIRNPVQHVVLPRRYLLRNPFLPVPSAAHDAAEAGDTLPVYRASAPEAWRAVRARRLVAEANPATPRSETAAEGYFTSSSGITIYRGSAYPAEYRGNAFLGEVAGNVVHRQTLSPDGVTFVARRADAGTEFVRSTDNWFRPVNFVNAPDGTLHVLDMYRETIEHPWSIPDDIKSRLDLESGRDRGRIYRLAPPGFQPPRPAQLGVASAEELVAMLEHPNSWQRETAHRLLFERQDASAAPALKRLLGESRRPLARLHALWSLAGLHALSDEDLLVALADEEPGVREHAVRLAESRLAANAKIADRVAALADDESIRVRFQVAFSLGEWKSPQAVDALARIARRDAADVWVRTALLSSAVESAGAILAQLIADPSFAAQSESQSLIRELALVVGARGDRPEIDRVLASLNALEGDKLLGAKLGVVAGLGDGLKRSGKSLVAELGRGETAAAEVIRRLLSAAEETALDDALPLDARREAVRLLAFGEPSAVRPTLIALLDTRQPQALQLAAVRAAAGFTSADVPELLLAGYGGFTPAVRAEVIEALLARPERIGPLLDAVEAKQVAVAQIPPLRRNLLLKSADDRIRRRAAALFASDAPGPRREVIAVYRPALARAADAARGRKVFERECLGCHRLGERGHDVGPNLLTIKHRTPDEVLTHVLEPNREVAPNYQEYIIVLDDGRTASGLITEETATSITLRRAEALQETILRRNIEEISATGQSLMPEGFEKKIAAQEMADLIAFLLESK